MLLRIVRAVPLAEVLLHQRRLAMEKLEARRAVLRRILCRDLIHGGCKGAKVTLQHVADRSGIKRQCLQNFRAGDFALGEASVARLEAAMRDLGLLIEQCAAGRSA